MKKTYKFFNKIYLNQKEVKEITYDFEEVTVDGITRALNQLDYAPGMQYTPVTDPNYHRAVMIMAVCAVNPEVDPMELRAELKGSDAFAFESLGVDFLVSLASKLSQQENSENLQETSQGSTTQA